MKKLLITRELDQNADFTRNLRNNGFEVFGISFLKFEPVHFEHIPTTDWIFFYSKHAFQYFLLHPLAKECLNNCKIAAVGSGTAKVIEDAGFVLKFVGQGTPKEVADAFLKVVKSDSVLFPHALYSQNSILRLIENEVPCHDIIVYKNDLDAELINFVPDIIVFTSPRNLESFLIKNYVSSKQKIISIGPTTSAALKQVGIIQFQQAGDSSEASLMKSIIEKR